MEGNARFVAEKPLHPNQSVQRREELSKGQHPFAVIVGCSDSRTPPEIIFDQGLGDLFVVRVAGQVVTDDSADLGSIEYAAEHLHVPLVLVLGHDKCGAVDATLKGVKGNGQVEGLIEAIRPAVEMIKGQPGDALSNAVDANVKLIVRQLKRSDPVLVELVQEGILKIVGARYHFDTGKVTLVEDGSPAKGGEHAGISH